MHEKNIKPIGAANTGALTSQPVAHHNTSIVVVVKGGIITEAFSNDSRISLVIVDLDDIEREGIYLERDEQVKGLHRVY